MERSDTGLFENVPSPFCGIASDDLAVQVENGVVKVVKNGDAFTVAGFETPITDTQPRIKGEPASLEQATAAAAGLLSQSRLPVFNGFGTDVNDTRAALALIERSGGIFDQMRAVGGLRNLLVLADSGWFASTLGELKNRVEVLLVFGSDIEPAFPRFFERFIWNKDNLLDADTSQREVIYLGPAPSGTASTSPDGRAPQHIPCEKKDLPAVAAALASLAKAAPLRCETVGGIPLATLEALINRLREAHYSIVTWTAGQLDFPHAELAIQQVCQTVTTLNKSTRSAILPLGGQDGDRTASQVCSWLTGYPTRVGFQRGFPEYDPYHHDSQRLLASGEADLLVWVCSQVTAPPPAVDVPTIVIGRSGMVFAKPPEVFIPVGAPGIDHAGHIYRCDNVVAMPVYKLRDSGLPSAATVLNAILAAL